MPRYEVTAPNGRKYEINAPQGATEEQILSYIQSQTTKPEEKQDTSIGRTALDQGLQGLTFALGDEITDALGAVGAKVYDATIGDNLLDGKSIGDLYDEARDNSSKRLAAQIEERPVLSIGANLAGALATGGVGATTKAGKAIGNSLRVGGTGARIAKGATSGATTGAAYGFGAGEGGLEDRIDSAGEGLVLGAAVGGAIPAIGPVARRAVKGSKTAIKGARPRSSEQLEDVVSGIKAQANKAYKTMRDTGAVIRDVDAQNIAGKLKNTMKEAGPAIDELHRPTLSILNSIDDATKRGNLSLEELDKYRSILGRLSSNTLDGENSYRATQLLKTLDNAVDDLTDDAFLVGSDDAVQALKRGRAEYSKARKVEKIVDVLKKADGDPNKIKSNLTRFITNRNGRNLQGFSKAEKQALYDAAANTTGEKLLKMFGKFGIDFGTALTPGNSLLPLAGAALGSPAITAGGTVARQGQKALARGKADQLIDVLSGVPQKPLKLPNPPAALSPLSGSQAGQHIDLPQARPQANIGTTFNNMLKDEAGTLKFGKDAKAARKWMNDNLRGKVYQNSHEGIDIEITREGIGETLQYNRRNLDSLPRIPELIENSELVAKRPDKKYPNSNRLLVFRGELDGEQYEMQVKAVSPPKGKGEAKNKYHLHRLKKIVAPATGFGVTTYPDSPDATTPIKPQSSLNVNDLLDRMVMAESGGDPNAQAATSTASGLLQFTDPTWRNMVKKYGKEHGIKMSDKNSPEAQYVMGNLLLQENADILRKALNREPTDGELYLAHFAGPNGAKRLLKAPKGVPAVRLLPKAAKANKSIFYETHGTRRRPRTAGEVVELLASKV